MTDEMELLRQARQYDQEALTEIYDAYSPGLYRYAMRLLGEHHLAEDCVSETFSRFLSAIQQGKGPTRHLQAYLYRVAHNWITDQYRRQPPPSLPLEQDLHSADQPDPSVSVGLLEEAGLVRKALANLTPDQRQVIVLRYLEDWSLEQVSLALHKPVGAIKALQHRAINSLKRQLVKEEEV
jgi:RNA polymerase sigma-70 factor, ECF subfamily